MRASYLIGFDSRKAAQIAAYFLGMQPGMEKLKLIKLIYLSEREFVGRFGHPMIYDELYSLKDGPICSSTLNGINGDLEDPYWSQLVRMDKNNRNVHPATEVDRDALDEVSDAEIEVLGHVWGRFGTFSASQIRQWTHDNCPEYAEVTKGRLPITYRDLAEAVGREDGQRVELEIAHSRRMASLFS